MAKDRLSQIWDRFSTRTSLDVSSVDIRHTPRPGFDRQARPGEAADPMQGYRAPELKDVPDPVAAALQTMHAHQQMEPKRGRRAPTAPQPGQAFGAGADAPRHAIPPASGLDQTLLADLAFTRSKTSRPEGDYITYAAARQAEWQRRKRKKFLGLF